MNRRQPPVAAVLMAALLFVLPGRVAAFAPGPGLFGVRTYGIDPTVEHFDSARLNDAVGAVASVNLPVLPGLDAALSYGAARLTSTAGGRTPEVLSVTAVDYTEAFYGNSYVSVTAGHAWDVDGLMGVTATNAESFWEVGTGVEIAYSRTTAVNLGVAYSASFDRDGRNPTWRYSLLANHWFSRRLAGVIGISYLQVTHAPDSLRYTIGIRVSF